MKKRAFRIFYENAGNLALKKIIKRIVFILSCILSVALFSNAGTETNWDDMANIIGGFSPEKDYKKIENEKFWPGYQKKIEDEWLLVSHYKVKRIRKWTDSKLPDLSKKADTLFYPFGGADFLYSNSFFPNMKNYILIGLEPIGRFLDLDTLPSEKIEKYLKKITKAMSSSNRFGYFQTKHLADELNQEDLNGTLPLLAFYIKRCGYRILEVRYLSLDKSGTLKAFIPQKNNTPCVVQFDFRSTSDSQKQTLYYFSYDLSDENLNKNNEILLFARSFGKLSTYLKAASYLLHRAQFDVIRKFILDTSEDILEDDSGIPYRQFNPGKWEINLYGTYSRTIKLFKNKYQPDLKNAFDKSPYKGDLPFWIGYNLPYKEVNLLYAKKKVKHHAVGK